MHRCVGNGFVLAVLAVCSAEASDAVTPVAVSPGGAANVVIAARCPSFDWAGVAGAEWHDLVVYRVGGSAPEPDPVLAERVPGNALGWSPSLDRCLERGVRYAWSVKAIAGGESSAWSEPLFFEIARFPKALSPPGAPPTAARWSRTTSSAAERSSAGDGAAREAPRSSSSADDRAVALRVPPGEHPEAPSRTSATTVGNPSARLTVAGEVRSIDSEGNARLWGRGRPGIVVYGPGGIGGDSCVTVVGGGGLGVTLHYGLSNVEVPWASAAEACPAGTWVCTGSDLTSCNTNRPDDSSDGRACDGSSFNADGDDHRGWLAGTYEAGMGTHGSHFSEGGAQGHSIGCVHLPVWCCW